MRWSSNGPPRSRTDSERGRSSLPLTVNIHRSGTRSRAQKTCPPHREGKSADTRLASSDPCPVCQIELSSPLSTVSGMSPLGSTRSRAPRDTHTAPRQTCRVCDNARRSGPEPSASSRPRRGGNEPPPPSLRCRGRGLRRRRKRKRFDAREELCDHFSEKLLRHAGRQRSRRTFQLVSHEMKRETPRIRIRFAQEFFPTRLLGTPYRSPDPDPRSPLHCL